MEETPLSKPTRIVIHNNPVQDIVPKLTEILKIDRRAALLLASEMKALGALAIETPDIQTARRIRDELTAVGAGNSILLQVTLEGEGSPEPVEGFPFKAVGRMTAHGLELRPEFSPAAPAASIPKSITENDITRVEKTSQSNVQPLIDPAGLELPWRKKFQFHLSTAFILMLVGGVLIPLNVFSFSLNLLLFTTLTLFATAFLCEWSISLQQAAKREREEPVHPNGPEA